MRSNRWIVLAVLVFARTAMGHQFQAAGSLSGTRSSAALPLSGSSKKKSLGWTAPSVIAFNRSRIRHDGLHLPVSYRLMAPSLTPRLEAILDRVSPCAFLYSANFIVPVPDASSATPWSC